MSRKGLIENLLLFIILTSVHIFAGKNHHQSKIKPLDPPEEFNARIIGVIPRYQDIRFFVRAKIDVWDDGKTFSIRRYDKTCGALLLDSKRILLASSCLYERRMAVRIAPAFFKRKEMNFNVVSYRICDWFRTHTRILNDTRTITNATATNATATNVTATNATATTDKPRLDTIKLPVNPQAQSTQAPQPLLSNQTDLTNQPNRTNHPLLPTNQTNPANQTNQTNQTIPDNAVRINPADVAIAYFDDDIIEENQFPTCYQYACFGNKSLAIGTRVEVVAFALEMPSKEVARVVDCPAEYKKIGKFLCLMAKNICQSDNGGVVLGPEGCAYGMVISAAGCHERKEYLVVASDLVRLKESISNLKDACHTNILSEQELEELKEEVRFKEGRELVVKKDGFWNNW